jgi:hypothetical protein
MQVGDSCQVLKLEKISLLMENNAREGDAPI